MHSSRDYDMHIFGGSFIILATIIFPLIFPKIFPSLLPKTPTTITTLRLYSQAPYSDVGNQ